MTKPVKLTRDEHVRMAEAVRWTRAAVSNLDVLASAAFGSTHRASKSFAAAVRAVEAAMDALDAEYHRVISEQDFRVLGNVYYNGGTERLDAAPSGPALLNYVLKGAPDEPTQTPPHP